MKIAFFSKQLPSDEPNGVSVQVHRLAGCLTVLGHDVTVFTFSPKPDDAPYHVNTLPRRDTGSTLRKFTAARMFASVTTGGYDILHYHGDDYLSSGSHRRVRTFYGSALREAIHAKTPGRFFYQALFYFFEWISCIRRGRLVTISNDTKRWLPLITVTIPCGVPLDRYRPAAVKTAHPSLLFLGDFNSRKRGSILLDAFKKDILTRFPDAILTVVGPVPCTGNGIRYAGRLSEDALIEAYRIHWVFCMPSSYEGFGVPMIEAMACGTPVVATINAGSRRLIEHETNGLLCREEDLGKKLVRLLGDSALRERCATGGAKTAHEYDITSIARRYEELYRTLIETAPSRQQL